MTGSAACLTVNSRAACCRVERIERGALGGGQLRWYLLQVRSTFASDTVASTFTLRAAAQGGSTGVMDGA